MGAQPRSLWDGLASFLHKPCQVGHISWAAGRRPGYPPAFLALCTHDLIPALQRHGAGAFAPLCRGNGGSWKLLPCPDGHLARHPGGPRLHWDEWGMAMEPTSHCPVGLTKPTDPIPTL